MHQHYLKNVASPRLQAFFHASIPAIIADETAPISTNCPSKIIVVARGTTASVTWTAPTASDNCGPVNDTSTHISSSSFPNGTPAVIFNTVDGSGYGAAPCTFNVNIVPQGELADDASICGNYKWAATPFKSQRTTIDPLRRSS